MPRTISILAWMSGAIVVALLYAYVTVYLFGWVDHAYGAYASFQIVLMLALFFLASGLVGASLVVRLRTTFISPRASLLAGVLFAVLVWLYAAFLGWLFPNRDVTVVSLLVVLALGAISIALVSKNAG